MDKKRKSRVRGVAIFVVFLALASTIMQFQKQGTHKPTYNFKESANEYRELKFIYKAQVRFASENVRQAQENISKMIADKAVQMIRKQNESNSGAYIFSVPHSELKNILSELRQFGSIGSHVEQVDTALVNIDINNERARLVSYEKELVDLSQVRFPSDQQIRRKEALHGLIQSTLNNLDKLGENVLLYITLVPKQIGNSITSVLRDLAMRFITWLVIFSVATVLAYYGTKLIMYFLSALGIKGISAGGLGGGYNYGGYTNYSKYARYFGRYSYGGSGSRRKVKRVYKDKPSVTTEDDNNKD